jgi:hypothetical protein
MGKSQHQALRATERATKKVQRLKEREERRKPADQSRPKFQSRYRAGLGSAPTDQGANWADPTDSYANAFDNFIYFQSTISGEIIKFKAMLTQFEDQFSSEWNSEQVYGRNDPIQTFKNTTRKISIGWDVPAASYTEAEKNMVKASELTRMLYPSYETRGSVSTINQAPMIKVSFRNLIRGYDGGFLFVTLDGITFSPDLEAGWFDIDEDTMAISGGGFDLTLGNLVPKLLKFSCVMTVLHQVTVGYAGTEWPTDLEDFPNLPPGSSRDAGNTAALAAEARQGAGFEAEEEAKFDKALDKAIMDAADADMLTSNKQISRASRKNERQGNRAEKLSSKIKAAEEAEQAAILDLWKVESPWDEVQ